MHVFLLCSIQISTYLSNLLMTAAMFGSINRWKNISCLVEDINHIRFKYWVQENIVIFSYTNILQKAACHFSFSATLRKNVIKSFNDNIKRLSIMTYEFHHTKETSINDGQFIKSIGNCLILWRMIDCLGYKYNVIYNASNHWTI